MCRVLGFVLLLGWVLVSCSSATRQVHTTPVDILRDHYRAPRIDPRLAKEPLRRQRAIDLTDTLRILRNQPYIAPATFPSVVPITGPCVWQTAGPTNVNGRVTAIAVDESDPQRIFVATVGGVWRSRDGGRRWTRITDNLQAGVFGAVAITPGSPDEVFIGGGDPNLYYYTLEMRAGGPGLWQSTNGGEPVGWQALGPADLTNAVIFRIRVDPDAPHNVYVAASSGLWFGRRTTATGPFTWARLGDFDAPCSDVVVDFSSPNDFVYAACYPASTVDNGIWKYDGITWTKTSSGITTSQAGFIRLAIARRNPKLLYAMIEKASDGSLMGVYKTEVGAVSTGTAWAHVETSAMDDSWDYTGFNCLVEVDSENENIVYVGTTEHLFRSTDKGANWSEISDGADYNFPNTRLHDDQHAMALVKATPGAAQCDIVIVGNDGGLDRADLSKTPWHWENIGHGINATEYYYLATQQATGSLIAGGTQDNGSPITYGNRSWYGDPACDGSYVGVEGKNGCTFYQVCYTGSTEVRILRHVVPGFAGINMRVNPSTSVPLCPPIATHPTENGKALAGGCPASGSPTLLSTGDGVAWTRVKDGSSSTISFPSDAEITALGIGSPSTFQSYYVGFKRVSSTSGSVTASTIWATQDAGLTWVKPGNTGAAAQINAFALDATNPLRAFAALGGGERVLMTTNGGASWTGIAGTGAGSLPPVAATGAAIDPWDPDLIYVSTDVGVFRGKPSTRQWWPFDEGLPRGIDVNDIAVNKDAGTLMIGTMGYGAFTRDIRPGIDCRLRQASIRDNVFDRGLTPSPGGFPDPEHPIEDISRSISTSPSGHFYKPDDTVMGRSFWWTSTDIRVDRPTASKLMNQVAVVDHVALEGCPVEVAVDDCPAGAIVDRAPVRTESARVLVQVTNRGTAPIRNLRVTALWADATTSLPLLPVNFWSTQFPEAGACVAVTSGPWLSVDPTSPCKDLAIVRPEYPEVVEFRWEVPDNAPAHSCILAMVETADDPIDPLVRSGNERRPWILVPENRQIALRNLHVEDAPLKPLSAAAHRVEGLDSLRLWNPTTDPRPFTVEISRTSMRATGKLGLMLPQDSDSLRLQGMTSRASALSATQLAAVRNLGVDTTKVHWVTSPEATIENLEVAPGESKKLAVIYDSGNGPPWGTTRFVVAARRDRTIFGGSTYLLRTPVKP